MNYNFEKMTDEELYKHAQKVNKDANDIQKLANAFPFIVGILMLLSVFYTVYHCPFLEAVSCDQNYSCTINQKFIFNIHKTKKFYVNTDSIVNIEQRAPFMANNKQGHKQTYYIYPVFYSDNKKIIPFIGYIDSSADYTSKEELNKRYEYINNEFKSYLENPDKRFYLEAISNGFYVIILILTYIIGVPLWWFLQKTKKS